jgi:hypothetical protein
VPSFNVEVRVYHSPAPQNTQPTWLPERDNSQAAIAPVLQKLLINSPSAGADVDGDFASRKSARLYSDCARAKWLGREDSNLESEPERCSGESGRPSVGASLIACTFLPMSMFSAGGTQRGPYPAGVRAPRHGGGPTSRPGRSPDQRGQGLGTWLLAHDLAVIDEEHCAAYLESSNSANNRRYASVGFEPLGEFSYPGNGPVLTTMWRSAR